MFGYIIVNKQELKFREFDVYQSYYCGLCQSLKERFGRRGQLTLSYDMTFVALLLSALYDEPVESSTCKCVAHPFEAHATSRSVFTDYAADMNLLLSYYKCLDDWTDERKWKGRLRAAALRGRDKMVEARYPEKAEHIYTLLEHIHLYEKAQEPDVDLASGCFGEIMGEILACRKDEWEDDLRRMGFFLGKFIYLMDAYEDLEKDLRKFYPNMLPIGAGCCTKCKTCTCPDAPCRFPDQAFSSMEAYGMLVMQVCQANHLDYYYGPGKIAYTSCYLLK